MGKIAVYGYTVGTINQRMADLNHLFLLMEQAQREKGDAQHPITFRNKKLKELDEWVFTCKRIARLVFEKDPRHIEKLGIVVKS